MRRTGLDVEQRYADICSTIDYPYRFVGMRYEIRFLEKYFREESYKVVERREVKYVIPDRYMRERPSLWREALIPQVR